MEDDDERLRSLNEVVYGIVFPIILSFGFFGSILNFAILFTKDVKAVYDVYLKGMCICDFLVLLTAVPFAIRLSSNLYEFKYEAIAFYYAYLELYLSNSFAGTGVLLTVAITSERYLGLCHPFVSRSLSIRIPRHPQIVTTIVPIFVGIIYIPYIFAHYVQPVDNPSGNNTTAATTYTYYIVLDNETVTENIAYEIYDYLKEVLFRLVPGIVLTYMNIRIIYSYRRASRYIKKKHALHISVSAVEVNKLKEDWRVMYALIGLTLQFLVCTTPAAILGATSDEKNNRKFGYSVFRAIANSLEMVKNSSTFYVYCIFSYEYRSRVRKCVSIRSSKVHFRKENKQEVAEEIL